MSDRQPLAIEAEGQNSSARQRDSAEDESLAETRAVSGEAAGDRDPWRVPGLESAHQIAAVHSDAVGEDEEVDEIARRKHCRQAGADFRRGTRARVVFGGKSNTRGIEGKGRRDESFVRHLGVEDLAGGRAAGENRVRKVSAELRHRARLRHRGATAEGQDQVDLRRGNSGGLHDVPAGGVHPPQLLETDHAVLFMASVGAFVALYHPKCEMAGARNHRRGATRKKQRPTNR